MRQLGNWKIVLLAVAVMLSASSCMHLVGAEGTGFRAIPPLEELNFGGITPSQAYEYWELRFTMGGAPSYDVVGSGGTTTLDQLDGEVAQAVRDARTETGFDVECMPAYCYKYVVSVRNGQVEIWNTTEQLEQFLGSIENADEAILLATGHGYYWDEESTETNGIRTTSQGYELVVLKLVKFCAPVQTDRFEILVSHDGELIVQSSEVWSKLDGACI